jgi:DNA polymerase III epsilon subunit-like protein
VKARRNPTDSNRTIVRAGAFTGLRVVVCDNETTGLDPINSRIVSVALNEIVSGRVFGGYARLIDPGKPVIGASEFHGVTLEVLHAAYAPMFTSVAPDIQERLTAHHGDTMVLAGFNVVFDALMLHNELARLGESLSDVSLLEVGDLAARAGIAGESLRELARSLNITAHDPHSSIGDTTVTTEALLQLVDRLASDDPAFHVTPFLHPFDPTVRLTRKGACNSPRGRDELTREHVTSHETDLTHKTRREAALAVCVNENRDDLYQWCADGIIDQRRALQVAEWVGTQLERDDLIRATRGHLLAALAYAAGETEDGRYIHLTGSPHV